MDFLHAGIDFTVEFAEQGLMVKWLDRAQIAGGYFLVPANLIEEYSAVHAKFCFDAKLARKLLDQFESQTLSFTLENNRALFSDGGSFANFSLFENSVSEDLIKIISKRQAAYEGIEFQIETEILKKMIRSSTHITPFVHLRTIKDEQFFLVEAKKEHVTDFQKKIPIEGKPESQLAGYRADYLLEIINPAGPRIKLAFRKEEPLLVYFTEKGIFFYASVAPWNEGD